MSTPLANLRHSLSHLLAAAVLELWPDTKPTLGPAIENGFYYDFEFSKPVSDEDLPKIEKKMRQIGKSWKKFTGKKVSEFEAMKMFQNNKFKQELIAEIIAKKEPITLYTSGEFTDLCRGGHVDDMKEVDLNAFKLTRVAGAYWRGDEKNQMLTRIYGVVMASKKELDEYLRMMAEARKRDHKILGPQLDLFTFSDLVGPGLPLWTPKGTILRTVLDDFIWSLRQKHGYEKVEIPHIAKKNLYITSGHWEKFSDDLFRITTREGHEFVIKPMNCPHHTQIYARCRWSYRELPQRYCNTTMVYRDEQTGELAGLSRVRCITQDDAHVFCRLSQVKDELERTWDIVHEFYGAFGFDLRVRLSLYDPKQPDKYLGDPKLWQEAERILHQIAKENQADAFEGIGEAAFYGPKLDFMAKDSLGRAWQVATIQLDMSMPEQFDLTCVNEKGEDERIVMIHCAVMGSIERFVSILIEHYAGAFPAWLAPVQVALLPVSTDKHLKYCQKLADELKAQSARVWIDDSDETVGKKIHHAEQQKIPFMLVVGDKEMGSGKLAVREHGSQETKNMGINEFLPLLSKNK